MRLIDGVPIPDEHDLEPTRRTEPMPEAIAPPAPVKGTRKPRAPKAAPAPDALIRDTPTNPLDVLVAQAEAGDLSAVLTLIFWQQRFENPGFSVEITPREMSAFKACTDYLEVQPMIRVFRPGGVAATPDRAHPKRPGHIIPGRPEIPPKDLIVVQMTDRQGNGFVAIENNQQDLERQQEAKRKHAICENAMVIANTLQADLNSGQFSTSNIQDAITTLVTLAGRNR